MRQLKIVKTVTNKNDFSLEKYLQEIRKLDLISAEEEADLARKIKSGDSNALEKMVKANLRFVISVAKQYQNQGLPLQDLINEGNVGLIKAAMRFDETRGFKFISYAVWWIRQTIQQAIAEHARIIRLPVNRMSAIHKINRTFSYLEQKFEREPSVQEVAEVMNIAPFEIKELIRGMSKTVSMDAPLVQDEELTLYDIISGNDFPGPDKNLLSESLKKEIERILSMLSFREADILRLYYGLNGKYQHTLDEIGEKFHLTRERVRQIKEGAINRLKGTNRCKRLEAYLS
jgi:RNA polymerase primary sigma factor